MDQVKENGIYEQRVIEHDRLRKCSRLWLRAEIEAAIL